MQFRTTASTANKSAIQSIGRVRLIFLTFGMHAKVDRVYDVQNIERGDESVAIDVQERMRISIRIRQTRKSLV